MKLDPNLPKHLAILKFVLNEAIAIFLLLLFLLFVFSMFAGCSHHENKPQILIQYKNIPITLVSRYHPSSSEIQGVLLSVERHLDAWETDFSRPSLSFKLTILWSDDFAGPPGPSGTHLSGLRLWGLTQRDNITCTIGWGRYKGKIPVLYHELCHLNRTSYRGEDPGHIDPRWSEWHARSLSIGQ